MHKAEQVASPALNNQNIYEVNIRQYTVEGTFSAFAQHLPRLYHMGVKIIWLMPIYPIGKKNRKGSLGSYYCIRNFTALNPEFGNEIDFANLVAQIHSMDMRIIVDWVANHAAWDNEWTIKHADFFLKDEAGNFKNAYDWDDVIQINHANEAQQQSMIAAMQYWITNYNIDGFRADLAHLTPLPFWVKAKKYLSKIKPNLIWLAETEEIDYHQVFNITYTWKWMHEMELFCQGKKTLLEAVKVLEYYKNEFPQNAIRMFFTSNHDENSWNGTEYEKYGAFAQLMAVFSCCFVGIPLIYTGQELPIYNRLPFFDKAAVPWRAINELHTFYKTLYQFRAQNKLFETATLKNVSIIYELLEKNILAFGIKIKGNSTLVFLNFNTHQIEETVLFDNFLETYHNPFDNEEILISSTFVLNLPPAGFIILQNSKN